MEKMALRIGERYGRVLRVFRYSSRDLRSLSFFFKCVLLFAKECGLVQIS